MCAPPCGVVLCALLRGLGRVWVSRVMWWGSCVAVLFGGGIYSYQAAVALSGGRMSRNTAEDNGGGIFNGFETTVEIDGKSTIEERVRENTPNNLAPA